MNLETLTDIFPFSLTIPELCAAAEEEPRLLYDRKNAARQLSISVRSLDYLIARGELQYRRMGKKILIPRGELVRYARGDHFIPFAGTPDKVQ